MPAVTNPEQKKQVTDLQQRIDTILAPYKAQLAKGQSDSPQVYKAIWRKPLDE